MEGEEASVIPEVMEEGGQGSGQDGDCNRGATPLVKVGEKRLVHRGNGAVGEGWEDVIGLAARSKQDTWKDSRATGVRPIPLWRVLTLAI